MGHIRLGTLPQSGRWRAVIDMLGGEADAAEVAAGAAFAAETDLSRMPDDPVFQHVMDLLVKLPLAARSPDFSDALASLGLEGGPPSNLPLLLAQVQASVDGKARQSGHGNDAGSLASTALLECLAANLEDRVSGLFETTAADIRLGLASMSSNSAFSGLARDFFARLTFRSLNYYLTRELANHQGPDARFSSDAARRQFQQDLARHTFEASLIVKEFAGGWYGKTVWRQGTFDRKSIDGFTRFAFKKLRSELAIRRADA